ncbi:NUDIX hydrolase [Microbulbifer aestuariivivens]|uniref:NUDIX hydrolase n=1 Tax=Microbulbifer aestuariivivens TaxID=1908308 RepID=UPI0031EC7803
MEELSARDGQSGAFVQFAGQYEDPGDFSNAQIQGVIPRHARTTLLSPGPFWRRAYPDPANIELRSPADIAVYSGSMRSILKKTTVALFLLGAFTALAFVLFPGLKYEIYRRLSPAIRWDISYAVTDKFLVGMIYFVERGDQLLLVRHSYQDKWALPGGWLNRYESFEESAQRELREEMGVEIEDFELLEVTKVPRSEIINIAIRGRLKDGKIRIRDAEIAEFRFFDLNALPDDLLYPHKPYIRRYLNRKPERDRAAEPQ